MTLRLVSALARETSASDPVQQYTATLRREGLAENTVRAYLSDLKRYGVDLPGVFVNPDAHADLAVQVSNESAPPRTRLRRLASLAKFFEFANPDAATNPYRTVRRPSLGVVLPGTVPAPEESRALVEALLSEGTRQGRRDAAALVLMAGEGLRVGEVVSLTARDVDQQHRRLLVEGKGRKTREVPLGEYVMDVLNKYVLTDIGPTLRGDTRLFPVTARTLQRAVKRAAASAGLDPGLHPHSLRHGFATAVIESDESGHDLAMLADLLGHASVDTTRIYTHISDTRRARSVDAAL